MMSDKKPDTGSEKDYTRINEPYNKLDPNDHSKPDTGSEKDYTRIDEPYNKLDLNDHRKPDTGSEKDYTRIDEPYEKLQGRGNPLTAKEGETITTHTGAQMTIPTEDEAKNAMAADAAWAPSAGVKAPLGGRHSHHAVDAENSPRNERAPLAGVKAPLPVGGDHLPLPIGQMEAGKDHTVFYGARIYKPTEDESKNALAADRGRPFHEGESPVDAENSPFDERGPLAGVQVPLPVPGNQTQVDIHQVKDHVGEDIVTMTGARMYVPSEDESENALAATRGKPYDVEPDDQAANLRDGRWAYGAGVRVPEDDGDPTGNPGYSHKPTAGLHEPFGNHYATAPGGYDMGDALRDTDDFDGGDPDDTKLVKEAKDHQHDRDAKQDATKTLPADKSAPDYDPADDHSGNASSRENGTTGPEMRKKKAVESGDLAAKGDLGVGTDSAPGKTKSGAPASNQDGTLAPGDVKKAPEPEKPTSTVP